MENKAAVRSYETLIQADITQDFIGRFPSFLKNIKKIPSAGTIKGYLSCLKMILEKKFGASFIANIFEAKWYERIRINIKKLKVGEICKGVGAPCK